MHGLIAQCSQPDTLLMAQSAISTIWDAIWPYAMMILGFSAIIFVHELGHFLVAKWADVRVEQFAIGFGREVVGITRGETRYSFNILPFGGYVKMLGQEDFEDKTQELLFKDDPRSFINKPVGRRMAIVSAGVVMNIIFACFLFMIVFMVGMQAPSPRIGYVEPDSPADKAGLLPGDTVMEVNGEKTLEFNDISMAILLAHPREPVEFIVERNGRQIPPLMVMPDYRRPESTREIRRQAIGISNGYTREIIGVGPFIDTSKPDSPHVGDLLVEADGVAITDDNASAMQNMLAYAKEIYVERPDPINPDAAPQRVRVNIPPQLTVFPSDSDDQDSINVLGLAPLVRVAAADLEGRGFLGGLREGDTVIEWDDTPYPNLATITRACRDNPEHDVHYTVRTADGRIAEGFVRPKQHRQGGGTVQAQCLAIPEDERKEGGAQARFVEVKAGGRAAAADIETGDLVRYIENKENPSAREVSKAIRNGVGKHVRITVQKHDGRLLATVLRPEAPGAIDVSFANVADDWLQIGNIVPRIAGQPSPAAKAGIPPGVRITSVDDQPVTTWRELIDVFRASAGRSVDLVYVDKANESQTVPFGVPHSLRTMLGVGSAARIVSVDDQTSVEVDTNRGLEEVQVGYHEGLRSLLTELIGRTVRVEFRRTPLSPVETAEVAITADMVDPWLGRIAFSANVGVNHETTLLKGENAFDALRIGLHKTYAFILQVYTIMDRMIFSRSVGVENLSGPLGIVSIGGKIARAGTVEFLFFLAIISANLAVINFLPLPIVDGGLMIFLIIEKIKGSPVSLRVQVATQLIGLVLIIGAFIFVTYNDVVRMVG